MSEQKAQSIEHQEVRLSPVETSAERQLEQTKRSEFDSHETSAEDQAKQAEQALNEARAQAKDSVLEINEDEPNSGQTPTFIDKSARQAGLAAEFNAIRAKLSPAQRLFSSSIHQPAIRQISSIGAKTVARPYGLLGGGVMAFCGSLVYLLFSKYIGIQYNYLIFLFLFAIGYILATLYELIFKRRQQTP